MSDYKGVVLENDALQFDFGQLNFQHEAEMVHVCGIATGKPIGGGKRLGGQAKALDYLFSTSETTDGQLCLHRNAAGEIFAIEGGFTLKSGESRFFIADKGSLRFSDEGMDNGIGGRFHYALAELAVLMLANETIAEEVAEIAELLVNGDDATEEIKRYNNDAWDTVKNGVVAATMSAYIIPDSDYWDVVNAARATAVTAEVFGGPIASAKVPLPTMVSSAPAFADDEEEEEEEVVPTDYTANLSKEDRKLRERVLKGEMLLEYNEWTDEQQSRIVPLSYLSEYIMSHDYCHAVRVIGSRLRAALSRRVAGMPWVAKAADVVNAIFQGKAATGKSTLARALSATFGLPIYVVECGQYDEEEKYGESTEILEGKFSKVESQALAVMREGGILVFEEADLPSDGVLKGAINNRLEAPFETTVEKGGKKVMEPRHPLCVMIATSNITDCGVDMESALLSRFDRKIRFTDPTEEEFISRLTIDGAPADAAKWAYDLFVRIGDLLKHGDVHREDILKEHFTFRACRAVLADALVEGVSPADAVNSGFICCIAERDPAAAESIWNAIQTDVGFTNPPSCLLN